MLPILLTLGDDQAPPARTSWGGLARTGVGLWIIRPKASRHTQGKSSHGAQRPLNVTISTQSRNNRLPGQEAANEAHAATPADHVTNSWILCPDLTSSLRSDIPTFVSVCRPVSFVLAASLAFRLAGTAGAQTIPGSFDARVQSAEAALAAARVDAAAARARACARDSAPPGIGNAETARPAAADASGVHVAEHALAAAMSDAARARGALSAEAAHLPAPTSAAVIAPAVHSPASPAGTEPAALRPLPPAAGPGDGDSLADSSPFLPRGTTDGGASAGQGPSYELRGIMSSSEGALYYVYDSSRKSGAWVGLNEEGRSFVVSSADPDLESVHLRVEGSGPLELTLRQSKTSTLVSAPQVATFLETGNQGFVPAHPRTHQERLMAEAARRARLRAELLQPDSPQP